jgi:hypothetical protein
MFDDSLSLSEITEDFFSHLYGEDWREFRDYLLKLEEALPFRFFSRDEARGRKNGHYDPEMAKKIATIRQITGVGRKLIQANRNSEYRVQTVALGLLEKHALFCDLISDWMAAKSNGEIESAQVFLEHARVEFGKYESEIKNYFDHGLFFSEFGHCQNTKPMSKEDVMMV